MKKLLSAVLAVIILMINIPLYGSAGATIEVFLIPDVSVVPADGVINYTVALDVGEPLALLQFSLDIPTGLTYVQDSVKLNTAFQADGRIAEFSYTESSKTFLLRAASGQEINDLQYVEIATFQCVMNANVTERLYVTTTGLYGVAPDGYEYDVPSSLEGRSFDVQRGESRVPSAPFTQTVTHTSVTLLPRQGYEYGVLTDYQPEENTQSVYYFKATCDCGKECDHLYLDTYEYANNTTVTDGTVNVQTLENVEQGGDTVAQFTVPADMISEYPYIVFEVFSVDRFDTSTAASDSISVTFPAGSNFLYRPFWMQAEVGSRYVANLQTGDGLYTFEGGASQGVAGKDWTCKMAVSGENGDAWSFRLYLSKEDPEGSVLPDESPIAWQDSNVFTDLEPGETYTFYQRAKATATTAAGAMSEPTDVRTRSMEVHLSDATETSITLWQIEGDEYGIQKVPVKTDPYEKGYYVTTQCNCEQDCNHIKLNTDGWGKADISSNGNTVTQVIPDSNAVNGTVPCYFVIPREAYVEYPYLIMDVKSANNFQFSLYGWSENSSPMRPFSNGMTGAVVGRYVADFSTGSGFFDSYVTPTGDVTFQIWIAGNQGASISFELYLAKDISAPTPESSPIVWQDSNVFTDLEPNTEYCFYQRIKDQPDKYVSQGSVYKTLDPLRFYTYRDNAITKVSPAISGKVTIPSSLGGNTITQISWDAFEGCDQITGIVIPDSIEVIQGQAFIGCTNLATVEISQNSALFSDKGMIGVYAFHDTAWYANQPDGLLYLCDGLLYGYKGEISVANIKEGTRKMADAAFNGCKSMTALTLPSTLKATSWESFRGCSNLVSVTIADGLETIEESSFWGCSSLLEIDIPNTVKRIEPFAFASCTSLTEITVPVLGGQYGGDYIFAYCTALTKVTLLEGIKKIDGATFVDCISLTTLVLPASIKTIHTLSEGSDSCPALTTVIYAGTMADRANITISEWNQTLLNAQWICSDSVNTVTYLDEQGQTVSSETVIYNKIVSQVPVYGQSGYRYALYADAQRTVVFNVQTPITKNTTVYLKVEPSAVGKTYAQISNAASMASQSTDIRFVSTVDHLQLQQVGFVLSLSNENPTVGGDKCTVYQTDTVYLSVFADGTSISAESLGGNYIYAVRLNNIPQASFDTPIYIRSFCVNLDGTYSYSELKVCSVRSLLGGLLARNENNGSDSVDFGTIF